MVEDGSDSMNERVTIWKELPGDSLSWMKTMPSRTGLGLYRFVRVALQA